MTETAATLPPEGSEFERAGVTAVDATAVDDDLLVDGQPDATMLDATGRLAGGYYATTRDRFHLERPP